MHNKSKSVLHMYCELESEEIRIDSSSDTMKYIQFEDSYDLFNSVHSGNDDVRGVAS